MRNALMIVTMGNRLLIHDVDFELYQDGEPCIVVYKENVLIMFIDCHSLKYDYSNEFTKYYTIC